MKYQVCCCSCTRCLLQPDQSEQDRVKHVHITSFSDPSRMLRVYLSLQIRYLDTRFVSCVLAKLIAIPGLTACTWHESWLLWSANNNVNSKDVVSVLCSIWPRSKRHTFAHQNPKRDTVGVSEQQQTAPAHSVLNNAQLSAKLRSTDIGRGLCL